MFEEIELSNSWIKIEKLNKGWSKDIKYHIYDINNNQYLLRISDIALYDKKKEQFDLLQKVSQLGINASKAIAFGKLSNNRIYTLLTWLEGNSAEDVIPTLTSLEACNLGFEAGKILQKLHKIDINTPNKTWWDKYQAKIQKKINIINHCNLEIPKKKLLINYVIEHMDLVKNKEQKFQHGDYHIGNMIVNNNKIGIIDFDKNGIADPYDEFKPFCWNVFKSEYFETGLINGYFNNKIPDDFFPILALYAAESLISHLQWAITYGEDEIKTAYKVIDAVLKWYDNFNLVVPKWYKI